MAYTYEMPLEIHPKKKPGAYKKENKMLINISLKKDKKKRIKWHILTKCHQKSHPKKKPGAYKRENEMLISLKKYKKIKNKKMAYTYLMLLEIPTKESTKEKMKC